MPMHHERKSSARGCADRVQIRSLSIGVTEYISCGYLPVLETAMGFEPQDSGCTTTLW